MTKIVTRILLYGALAMILFLGYQLTLSWIKGIEGNPYATIYRTKPTRMAVEPLKPPKGSEVSTRPVQGYTAPPSKKNQDPQFTLGSWDINCPPQGATFEVTVNDKGVPQGYITAKDAGFFDVGRLREVYGYVDKSWELSSEFKDSWEVGVGYHHDLWRTGPLLTSLNSQIGYERTRIGNEEFSGLTVKVGVRVGVRF